MARASEIIGELVLPVVFWLVFGLATIFGIYHSFIKHDPITGFVSVVIPPYAIYMSAEAFFWHDDFPNVNWDTRLKNDTKGTYVLIRASGTIKDSKIVEYNDAVESFAKRINRYPPDKKVYLAEFGATYIAYSELVFVDVFNSVQNAISRGTELVLIESTDTKILEKRLREYSGADELMVDYQVQKYALTELFKGINQKKLGAEQKKMIFTTMKLELQRDLYKMKIKYREIFGFPPKELIMSDKPKYKEKIDYDKERKLPEA